MTSKSNSLISVSESPYNAGTPLSALLKNVTPSDLVYVRNHFDVPDINKADWSLDVIGGINGSISLSFDEICTLPAKTSQSHSSVLATEGKV